MTNLSLLLLFAIAQVLVCQALPKYQTLDAENEADLLGGDLKFSAQNEEQKSLKDDDGEQKKQDVEEIPAPAIRPYPRICQRIICWLFRMDL
ncbi:unnamed protein product [Dibothriocephalus latus]|uniref:Uncharacterized protein n=1 Tax=Dibothriocephalus latus TaxID=60516 RepID=A0A3P7NS19_DIBLA|nr:unnamed protein product [Dibothriocephalus latus]